MAPHRVEQDSLGPREVPEGAYWGIQTLRARENFPVSGLRASPHLVRAYAWLKLACVRTNVALGAVDAAKGAAVERAAEEVVAGKFADQFVVDVFQAGAGTSFNMNVNEVLANRALEILGLPARGLRGREPERPRQPRAIDQRHLPVRRPSGGPARARADLRTSPSGCSPGACGRKATEFAATTPRPAARI